MIIINKNKTTKICVTLSEELTNELSENEIFTFNLIDTVSNRNYIFTSIDESLVPNSHNIFTVTEKANPNTFNSEINIEPGLFDYKIYYTPSISKIPTIFELKNFTLCEFGILKCIGTITNSYSVTEDEVLLSNNTFVYTNLPLQIGKSIRKFNDILIDGTYKTINGINFVVVNGIITNII